MPYANFECSCAVGGRKFRMECGGTRAVVVLLVDLVGESLRECEQAVADLAVARPRAILPLGQFGGQLLRELLDRHVDRARVAERRCSAQVGGKGVMRGIR